MSPSPQRTARSRSLYDSAAWHAVALASLGAAVFGVYWVTVRAPFVFDDIHFIVGNPGLQQELSLDKLLSDGLQETRPLYQLSVAANFAAGRTVIVEQCPVVGKSAFEVFGLDIGHGQWGCWLVILIDRLGT